MFGRRSCPRGLEYAQFARGVSGAAGEFKIRVAFETEYGIIFSELPDAIRIK